MRMCEPLEARRLLSWTVFSDDFNGAVGAGPSSAWTGYNDGNNPAVIYTNTTPTNATASNPATLQIVSDAQAEDGKALAMTLVPDPSGNGTYDSAEICTELDPAGSNLEYGHIEARIKLPGGSDSGAIWPAFWLVGDNFNSVGWPACGEIDVMENRGTEPGTIHSTLHGPMSDGSDYNGGAGVSAADSLSGGESFYSGYHVFAMDWQPNSITFSVDGTAYQTFTPADVPAGGSWVFNGHPFFLVMDVDEGAPFSPGAITSPQTMYVDYVRVTVPTLALTTPATATSVNVGDSYTINWSGGNATDTVQLWAEGGPNNAWTELTAGVPQTNGSYTWDTTGVEHGWYYFQAWDIPASGTPYAVQSPDYLHVVAPSASAPNISLNNPPLAGDSVAQGTAYTLNFTASDGSGDTNPIYVQLWMYSGDTGQWTEVPGANYLPSSPSSFALDTTALPAGWYCFAAHATNGDQWSYASSPGWVDVTVPTPTIAFTTPTSSQSVAAGGTFNLNWNISGLSSADLSNSTVQIWAQHLENGSAVWQEVAASVSASSGTYAWTVPTSPGAGTYYAFSVWLNYGDEWWAQASANWLAVS